MNNKKSIIFVYIISLNIFFICVNVLIDYQNCLNGPRIVRVTDASAFVKKCFEINSPNWRNKIAREPFADFSHYLCCTYFPLFLIHFSNRTLMYKERSFHPIVYKSYFQHVSRVISFKDFFPEWFTPHTLSNESPITYAKT